MNTSRLGIFILCLISTNLIVVARVGAIDDELLAETAEAQKLENTEPGYFWYNEQTGESQNVNPYPQEHKDDEGNVFLVDPKDPSHTFWATEKPEAYAWEPVKATEGEHAGSTYYHNSVTQEVVWEKPAALSWKKMSKDRVFFYNQVTGESRYDRPAEMGFFDETYQRTYWVGKDGETTWESEHWWTAVPSEEAPDRVYYYNEVTKETQWELPASMGWALWHEEL